MDKTNEIADKTQQKKIKIAFTIPSDENWTVGKIHFKNMLHALSQTSEREDLRFFLLTSFKSNNTPDFMRSMGADDIILYNRSRRWSPMWLINKLSKQFFLRDISMNKILKNHGIDVVFGLTLVDKYYKTPILSSLMDFQHVHLPEMFSETERFSRNTLYLRIAKTATRIILMSEAVKNDFRLFAPAYIHKVKVLSPVNYIPEDIYNVDLNSILKMYHLPEKFFYLPNQFWKHKNHNLVFKTIKILKEKGIKVVVVCTGNSTDYRHPTFFAELWHKLSQWKIRDQVIYLGLIPRQHVLMLIRQSICVLNPSMFEGWGYAVEESRSVGKRLLLSDIPVHREQSPPKAIFFNPYDCEELAKKMSQIWLETIPGPDFSLESKARENFPERFYAYGKDFLSIIKEVIQKTT